MVSALPELPDAAGRPRRSGARDARGGARVRLHAGRAAGDDRRLPRDPPGAGRAHRAARAQRAAGDRPVADPDGRVPRLGRDPRPQPGGRLGTGDRFRRADAGRVPPRHVRPRRPDAADPAPRRRGRRGRVARRPGVGPAPRVPLGVARRLVGSRGVPSRRLRQRGRHVRGPRPPRRGGRALPRMGTAVVRRRPGARHVRHRSRGPRARAGGARRPPERGARVERPPDQHAVAVPERGAGADRRRPLLARRDALRGARQCAHGRGERADRHQAGRGTRRDAAGALRGAAHRAPRRRRCVA